MQVDGEPMLVNPCTINIQYHNKLKILSRKKTTCKLLLMVF